MKPKVMSLNCLFFRAGLVLDYVVNAETNITIYIHRIYILKHTMQLFLICGYQTL